MKITQKLASLVFPSPRSNGKSSDAHRTDPPPNEANNNRCEFTFSDGRRCRNQTASLCVHHSSREEQEGRTNGSLDEGLIALCGDLTTATNINRALAQVFLLMAQGRIPQKQAVAFGYLSQLLVQTVPGIRSEHVSAHGYQSWQNKLKTSLMQNTDKAPEPSSGGENHDRPSVSVPVKSEISNIESPAASCSSSAQQNTASDYTSIFHRSLDLLDRKFDTTPEGRREASALILELESINPAHAKPRQNVQRSRRDRGAYSTAPPNERNVNFVAPPSRRPAQPCSSGRHAEASGAAHDGIVERPKGAAITPLLAQKNGGRPEACSVSAPAPYAASVSPTNVQPKERDVNFVAPVYPEGRGASRRASMPPELPPHLRSKRKAPMPPTTTAHSTDWYAPASWSAPRPDPFPSRQEKLKRKLRTMSDRRQQHQNQSRAFWC